MATAGRILIIPKGEYDASAKYEMLDLVNYSGIPYLAKKTSVGIAPTNEEYWHPMIGIAIANNLNTEAEGYVLDARQGKVITDLLATKITRTLLWSGTPVSQGEIVCKTGQENYTEFDIYCDDGCIIKGYKVHNPEANRDQIQCGYCGLIGTGGNNYDCGCYIGLIDVYSTHFYLQGITMRVISSGEIYEGKTISKIYGIS